MSKIIIPAAITGAIHIPAMSDYLPLTPEQIVEATRYLIEKVAPGGGYALGSGNSLSKYVSVANYRAMLETARKYGAIY